MTNHPHKGRGFAHVTHFCLQTVDLAKISTPHAGINNGIAMRFYRLTVKITSSIP